MGAVKSRHSVSLLVNKSNHGTTTFPNSLLIMSYTSVEARHATDRSKMADVRKKEEQGL